jgi:hypothetical protein
LKFTNTEVFNFRNALRGMRNPLESWKKSDSQYSFTDLGNGYSKIGEYNLGENDIKLAQRLIKSGSEHRKFLRQIFISVDITAPLYWWKEFDTYKVGSTANSTSTMHKIQSKPITLDCFEWSDCELPLHEEDYGDYKVNDFMNSFIKDLERIRIAFIETKDKKYWKALIQMLPSSWLQTRTVTMNYENVLNMISQRSQHKLTEWSVDFIGWARKLSYAEELLFIGGDE